MFQNGDIELILKCKALQLSQNHSNVIILKYMFTDFVIMNITTEFNIPSMIQSGMHKLKLEMVFKKKHSCFIF